MRHYGLEGNDFLRILIFIFVLVLSLPAMADDTIFRNFVWGAAKADVRKFETAKFYKEEGDSFFFVEQPDEFRRVIQYDFKAGKLWGAKYEYQEMEFPNSQTAIDKCVDEELILEKLYGPMKEEKFIWKDKTYRNYPQFWARAFGSGDLRMEAVWQVNDTNITLHCFNDGRYYQLFYTLELAGEEGGPDARKILDLSAPQKNPAVSKP